MLGDIANFIRQQHQKRSMHSCTGNMMFHPATLFAQSCWKNMTNGSN